MEGIKKDRQRSLWLLVGIDLHIPISGCSYFQGESIEREQDISSIKNGPVERDFFGEIR